MIPRRLITPLLAFIALIVGAAPLAAQSQFDVDAYKRFLQQNATLDGPGLLAKYDAGRFLRSASTGFNGALFADSIDHHYNLTEYEKSLIAQNGFMVTERLDLHDFGSTFLEIYYKDLPVFVSTDAILHAIHRSYDDILIETERGHLIPKLEALLDGLHAKIPELVARYASEPRMAQMIRDVDLYLTVPRALLAGGTGVKPYFPTNQAQLDELLGLVKDQSPAQVPLMAEVPRLIDFSQFTPRGHYTQAEDLTRYFQAMIWIGRTEIYMIAPQAGDFVPTPADVQRQTINAVLITELLDASNGRETLKGIEDVLAAFIGDQDNVTLPHLDMLIAETGLKSAGELLDVARWESFQNTLRTKAYAMQRINSQILISGGNNPDEIVPASSFLLLGQRFIIDSYVTGQVVFDKITHNGQPVMRMLPSTYDILFALGNDAAGQLLQGELKRYPYAPNLAALRYLVDSYEPDFWNTTLYNGWLNTIRTLNPPRDRNGLPPFMRTAAWWQQKMNTQLASWAQLRHDNLLYAKQSYTGGVGCSYPKSLVEPIPEFYHALGRFADHAALKVAAIDFDDKERQRSIVAYFENVKRTSDTLGAIATKELANEPLTEAEELFLKKMLYDVPSGCTTAMVGWYPRLYYRGEDALKKKDLIVADVHTAPTDEDGNFVGWVLHGGTGPLNMAVVTCNMPDGKPVAFIGPVMSYYEHVSSGFKRLTDEEWETVHAQAPSFRPAFVNIYLAGKEGEAKGGEAVSLLSSVGDEYPAHPELPPSLSVRNYPNPFAGSTLVSFTIAPSDAGKHVELGIYDESGAEVKILTRNVLPAGNYTLRWDGVSTDGKPVAPGIYLYRLKVGDAMTTGKMSFVGGAAK